MDQAREFFTFASIGSLGGASVAVLVVTNTLRKLLRVNPVRACAIVSMLVVFAIAYAAGVLLSVMGFLLAIVNGCLLFCTVIGMQEFAGGATRSRPARAVKPHGQADVPFLASWLHPEMQDGSGSGPRIEGAG